MLYPKWAAKLDGFTLIFFKTFWGILSEAIIKDIQQFFNTGQLKFALNYTFLALIPKVPSTYKVDQFRPIALCNLVYKLISKILSSRLRHLLELIIHSSQATFVPHRSIGDNIIINHEVMFYMKNKKGSLGFMAIKVNLAKAYDRVEWKVLLHIFYLLGFHDKFIELIVECITIPQFFILLNRAPHSYCIPKGGIR